MSKSRVVKVTCQCGQFLFSYYKGGRGRLIKCYLTLIDRDEVGVADLALGARPCCPSCGKELGEVRLVRGRPALKLNQGAVRPIRL